jgi:hypothetical protein
MLDMGVGTPNPESTQEVEGAEGGDGDSTSQNKAKARVQKKLIVEQVKILDVDGNMKAPKIEIKNYIYKRN